ncbi:hypothetical protein LX15_003668 [Streptoalloteichus tenebrarius]|uniref:Uncharacterized protein n=1 Tax=Streptoalloteichus tenebrarius (strain ATCC 17920 / DSM 40477 / JCM 4838 / CBS 697.72 / NBRC 16177 / NCIMB 11028 / NRRL B-12390 / A12253. 1 / ISP 5477) TaxID=1933 RepID=A0ABT1HWS2_STRSD|nr:hypothetical protein [Streptoalloteichus tenebrarius]
MITPCSRDWDHSSVNWYEAEGCGSIGDVARSSVIIIGWRVG